LATILVIDDGSPDGTAEIVEDLARSDTRIVLHRRPGKLGLGTAHRLGFEYALRNGFRTVLTMDADLSHRPVDAPRLVARARQPGVDVAVGSRYMRGGHIEGWPASRRVLSYCANKLLRASLGATVRDCTGAFRAYDVAFVRTLPLDELGNAGYSAIPEQLLIAMQQGGTLVEEPITFVERQMGATKLTKRELGNSLLNVVHMYRRRRQTGAGARVRRGRPVATGEGAPAQESAVLVGSRQPDVRPATSAPAAAAGERPAGPEV
ncbi:MAG: glycosyltransferase, partial [Candidatus Dormibacteraeota bacterium]|nr:glycosyltransferase [Candidatus Dormibacteraeota bacterium]